MSVTAVDLKQCQDKLRIANDRIAALEARPVREVFRELPPKVVVKEVIKEVIKYRDVPSKAPCSCPIDAVRRDLIKSRKRIAELDAVIDASGVK